MYFTIHGKNIEFNAEHQRIYIQQKHARKPAKIWRRGWVWGDKKKLKEIVIDTCWFCVYVGNEMKVERASENVKAKKSFFKGGKLLTENFPECRFSIEWILKWCTKRQDINSFLRNYTYFRNYFKYSEVIIIFFVTFKVRKN